MKRTIFWPLLIVAIVLWLTLVSLHALPIVAGICALFVVCSAGVGIVWLLDRFACALMNAYVWMTEHYND